MIYREEHQERFLKAYNISQEDFDNTGISFKELLVIKGDFEEKFQMYDDAGASLVRILLRFDGVHSVKYRIKDSEHLIAKIIRKRIERPSDIIDLNNYETKIQDFIGIRILHLFKSDWILIHKKLLENFSLLNKPEANIREGDSKEMYLEGDCKVKVKAAYRSVHYIVKTEPTKKTMVAEIQVRTLLEEAWGEVDHKIRYPNELNNSLINQYLQIFNRLAGGADEMGDYVNLLKKSISAYEDALIKRDQTINELTNKLETSSLKEDEKVDLTDFVKRLSSDIPLAANQVIMPSLGIDWAKILQDQKVDIGKFKKLHYRADK